MAWRWRKSKKNKNTIDHKHLNLEPAQEHDLDQLPRDQQPQNQPDQDPYQDQVEQQQQLQRMLLAQQEMEHLRWEEQRRWEAERRLQEDTSASAKLYRFACALAEIALRVPPLFLLDELFKVSLGLYYSAQPGEVNTTSAAATAAAKSSYMYMTGVLGSPPLLYNESATVAESLALEDDELMDAYFIKAAFVIIPRVLLCITGCLGALAMFVLRTRDLVVVYLYLCSVGIIFMSYWTNVSAVKQILSLTAVTDAGVLSTSLLEDILDLNFSKIFDPNGSGIVIIENYVTQMILATFFFFIHLGPQHHILQYGLPISFTLPSLISVLPLPQVILLRSPVFAALLPLAVVKFVLWSSAFTIMQVIYEGYQHAKTSISDYGLSTLMEAEWLRLKVPNVLRMFWILRVMEHAGMLLLDKYELSEEGFKIGTLLAMQSLASMAKSLLISGCETITAVLGMTSIISFFCNCIGNFFQWILQTKDEDEKSIGMISAILFYILALQTGLTSLNPEKRFVRLCRNVCLLFTALLHFVHNKVNPTLMSLSASHNPSTHRHVRALIVCLFLVIVPIALLTYLWTNHGISTWLLAVSVFCVEVIVKVFVSLMIYSLFLIDAYRTTFWEKLDDYVYYIRSFGNTIEFCFGIFLFFNGAWILVFEAGGAIRALMMCIHAYFNIWCDARTGWAVFMKRRTAVNKINSLPEATSDQLTNLNDVCAICYQEMSSAKITRCNHFFHGVCIRKWLYVQDRCPMCHEILYKL